MDTFLFFGIAFSAGLSFLEPSNDVPWANAQVNLLELGPSAPLWASLAVADLLVKSLVALVALGPFRAISGRMLGTASQPSEG